MKFKIIASLINEVSSDPDLVDFDSIEVSSEYVTIDGEEYRVLSENEVNEALKDHLQETASYFLSSFLANMTDLPEEIFEPLQDNNDAVYKLIEKTCGVDEFIEAMTQADGVGHFLSPYDGSEYDLIDGYMAFRTN